MLRYPVWTEDFLFMKEFKTTEEQIELLKNRGLTFENEGNAKEILLNNTYYNIINGYKELFITPGTTDNFITGACFEEIYALYNFDKKLRDIFLEYILKIENNLRALISYYFSENHGNDNYLKLESFDYYNGNTTVSHKLKSSRIENIQDLIGTIHKEIANSINKKESINHYIVNHGFIPMWVLVNILSFGKISKFLELMKQSERVQISKQYNIPQEDLIQYVKLLAYFRNLCAHNDRIYNVKLPKYLYIPDNKYHAMLNISKTNTMYEKGKNDLFALVLTLKIMLNEKDYIAFSDKIGQHIHNLEKLLKTITIEEVLKKMNFPTNWYELKKF